MYFIMDGTELMSVENTLEDALETLTDFLDIPFTAEEIEHEVYHLLHEFWIINGEQVKLSYITHADSAEENNA